MWRWVFFTYFLRSIEERNHKVRIILFISGVLYCHLSLLHIQSWRESYSAFIDLLLLIFKLFPTICLNLEILAVIELTFIIEFMLLLGREKWHKTLSFLSDRKTRKLLWWFHWALCDKKVLVRSSYWGFLVWSLSLRKEKVFQQGGRGEKLAVASHSQRACDMYVDPLSKRNFTYNHEEDWKKLVVKIFQIQISENAN